MKTSVRLFFISCFFLGLGGCHSTDKKAEPPAMADTAYLRQNFSNPQPADSVTEFGSSEGDAEKDIPTPKEKK